MQLSGEMGKAKLYNGTWDALQRIIRTEGPFSLYNGLSAGLFRQATYTTTRMGVYMTLVDMMKENGKEPGFLKLAAAGATAGAIAALVGTPSEVALVRMTSDGRLPPQERRNYKNVFDALIRLGKEEGILNMWRGCGPTIGRAVVLNTSQLAVYSEAKKVLLKSGYFSENFWMHLTASIASGFACTVASLPVDILKTRIQTMKVINGVPEYRNALDCLSKTITHEGFFSLWKGFTPYFIRLGPHSVLTFLFFEQFKKHYMNKYS